jgi:hypothetical protein
MFVASNTSTGQSLFARGKVLSKRLRRPGILQESNRLVRLVWIVQPSIRQSTLLRKELEPHSGVIFYEALSSTERSQAVKVPNQRSVRICGGGIGLNLRFRRRKQERVDADEERLSARSWSVYSHVQTSS